MEGNQADQAAQENIPLSRQAPSSPLPDEPVACILTADGLQHFQSSIPLVSARILKASSEELDEVIHAVLQELLLPLGLDRGGLFKVTDGLCDLVDSCVWHAPGIQPVFSTINLAEQLPWTYHQIVHQGKTVARYGLDSLPAEAESDRRFFVRLGVKSALAIPLCVGRHIHHIIVVHSLREQCLWPDSFVVSLRLLGEIFVGALERRHILRSLETYQQRFEEAAAAAGADFWEYDLSSEKFWTTRKAKEKLGFSTDEAMTIPALLAKVYYKDRALLTKTLEKSRNSSGNVRVEYRVPGPAGSIRWKVFRGSLQESDSGAAKRLSGVTMDITERKQLEDKLREQMREINHLRDLLEQENTLLRSEAGLNENRHSSLGVSTAMQGVKGLIEQVARTDSTVLIQGETGTGKELIAQAIHQLSNRGKRLMITVNCAALPAALIESELFGREKGAYTGALSRQIGRFELAHGSTLLLDEIAEMPLETQAKLLRVLQNGVFERLGSPANITVDVRIVAATNRDLALEVEQGRFRRDLFYRLNVFPIEVPPLRDRIEDIPQLARAFVNEFSQRMGRRINRVADADMEKLMAYSWPGNVRELRNVIERAMITSKGNALDLSLLDTLPAHAAPAPILPLEEVERRHIVATLKTTQGRIKGKGGAAELLGLHPSTLYSRMRRLGVPWQS
ncbi:sigma 54-interacting transcriptional regulator [Desulfobulbus sp.]|uniref:sigma 54-interacting transcriptional regulator n=1 Tax=Desulfobulbus sp. TaxID=895 RepID=UPI00286F93E6|nr:sigma 54-interacting transcriptional regulator [Desulfobulbus sp.]